MIHLRIGPVRSSSLLRRAAGKRDLRDAGFDVEGDTVLVRSEAAAERLLERYPNLSRVDDGPEPVAEPDEEEQGGSEDGSTTAEELADAHWNTAVTAVENGEADAFLDELAEIDGRNSVQDAIAARREA